MGRRHGQLRGVSRALLLNCVLTLTAAQVRAQTPGVLAEQVAGAKLGKHLAVLPDPGGQLGYDDADDPSTSTERAAIGARAQLSKPSSTVLARARTRG